MKDDLCSFKGFSDEGKIKVIDNEVALGRNRVKLS